MLCVDYYSKWTEVARLEDLVVGREMFLIAATFSGSGLMPS